MGGGEDFKQECETCKQDFYLSGKDKQCYQCSRGCQLCTEDSEGI